MQIVMWWAQWVMLIEDEDIYIQKQAVCAYKTHNEP